ncbi:SEL1-like repeat protein [Aliiglaciecola aliphaticivorans]
MAISVLKSKIEKNFDSLPSENAKILYSIICFAGCGAQNTQAGRGFEYLHEVRSQINELGEINFYDPEIRSPFRKNIKAFMTDESFFSERRFQDDLIDFGLGSEKKTYDGFLKFGSDPIGYEAMQAVFCISALLNKKTIYEHLVTFIKDVHKTNRNNFWPLNQSFVKTLANDVLEQYQIRKKEAITDKDKINSQVPNSPQPFLSPPPQKNSIYYYGSKFALDIVGRKKEQEKLRDFLNAPEKFLWFQLAGVAGQGKSRLAYDLTLHAQELGWSAGLLNNSAIEMFSSKWTEWQPNRPHLLVLDYILGREEKIKVIIQILSIRLTQGDILAPVRLLLVERQRWDNKENTPYARPLRDALTFGSLHIDTYANWFLKLNDHIEGKDQVLVNSRFLDGLIELKELCSCHLVQLVRKIAFKENKTIIKKSDQDIEKILNQIDSSGRPLYAFFLGQELSYDESERHITRQGLLTSVLQREFLARWNEVFKSRQFKLLDDNDSVNLVILATIVSEIELERDIHTKNDISELNSETLLNAQVLTSSDNTESIIYGIQPDLLGEWFVLFYGEKNGKLKKIVEVAWNLAPLSMLSFLERLTQDFPHHRCTKNILLNSIELQNAKFHILFVTKSICENFIKCNVEIPSEFLTFIDKELSGRHGFTDLRNYLLIRLVDRTNWFKYNPTKALSYCQYNVSRADPDATSSLGWFYLNGIGIQKNFELALKYFSLAKTLGCVSAPNNLGWMYANGFGVKKDIDKALSYFSEGATLGHAAAISNLGWFYEYSDEVPKDLEKAFGLFKLAAEKGDEAAMLNLGSSYELGKGVGIDLDLAFYWYLESAKRGLKEAEFNVGLCYSKGIGVTQDFKKAFQWYKYAETKGLKQAEENLDFLFEHQIPESEDFDSIIEWYIELHNEGELRASYQLGVIFEQGKYINQNLLKAFEYYKFSAENGFSKAYSELGRCLRDGVGCTKNAIESIEWFNKK